MGKFKRKKATRPPRKEKQYDDFGDVRYKYLKPIEWMKFYEENLLYNSRTLKQVDELAQFLESRSFKKIEMRALQKRPNLPFIVLLHGPSGTGKTALVREICRRTKRHMLEVKVELLRNSDLGKDEKVITDLFEEYAESFERSKDYPIMFFDECEAHLCKRMNTDSHNPTLVNHLNNIVGMWLKEFQDFHGILFLATNRKDDIDDAFARRILYQIEVEHPDKETQAEIWKTLFPRVLSPEQCKQLAEETNFSGGQIKQVQTKADIHELLHGKITFETIRSICETNGKTNTDRKKIGFSL